MVSRVLLCVWVVLNLAGICRAPAPARGTDVCGACVPLARCPPVARILEGYPYSTHSYFYAAVSCGTVLAPLVCCDADVVGRALAAETEAARAHAAVYLDIPGTAYGGGGEEDRLTQDTSVVGGVGGDTAATAAACARNTKFRTIGREETSAGVFPWMARIFYEPGDTNGFEVHYLGAGSLVTARYVLTAARSLILIRLRSLDENSLALVTLGTDHKATLSFFAERLVPHAAYNPLQGENDIGLVRLDRPAVFTDTVMPICLPFGELAVDLKHLPLRAMLAAGWETTITNSSAVPTTLQYTRLTYEPLEQCAQLYSDRYNVTIGPDQICGVVGAHDRDFCTGYRYDGGAVFVWEEGEGGGARAVGIVSSGCGAQDEPLVYTRIDAYQRWIEDHLAV